MDQHPRPTRPALRRARRTTAVDTLAILPRDTEPPAEVSWIADKFELRSVLARDERSVTYAASQVVIDRAVTIKVFGDPSVAGTAHDRIEREARTLARVDHEHVVRAFELGWLPDGRPYLVLEPLHGERLDARLARTGPIGIAEAVAITCSVLAALSAVHRQGVVHRNVRPASVWLVPRVDGALAPKLAGFDLVKDLASSGVTGPTEIVGEVAYCAPELLTPHLAPDEQTDVYAAAALLYELLTGAPPFHSLGEGSRSTPELIERVLFDAPSAPSVLRPFVGAALDRVVLRGLAKPRTRRYPSAAAFAAALACCPIPCEPS
ncbi:MAG: serine/threonine-protein kinase [Sandaracinaceae bacterium]